MFLKILGSSSSGNGYILYNDEEALIIECGFPLVECLKALSFNLSKIKGVFVTHEHGDHSKFIHEYINACLPVYTSKGTIDGVKDKGRYAVNIVGSKSIVRCGGFKVLSFDTQHDSNEPLGFLISHKDCGNILFATDTYYIKYRFPNLNHILLECNYDIPILSKNVDAGEVPPFVMKRIMKSHMSLETCIKTLEDNDISKVDNIVLLHLSGNNSEREYFHDEVVKSTGKMVYVAERNLLINLNMF